MQWLPSAETMGLDRKLLKAHEAEDFETEPWPEAVGGMPSVGGGRAEIVSRDGIGFALDALAAVTSM